MCVFDYLGISFLYQETDVEKVLNRLPKVVRVDCEIKQINCGFLVVGHSDPVAYKSSGLSFLSQLIFCTELFFNQRLGNCDMLCQA